MAKSIIKELIIVLLLCLAIILVLGILFYEYIPIAKEVPEDVKYSTSDEIQEQKTEIRGLTADEEYYSGETDSINSDDLNNYRRTQDYVPGKANPFAAYETTAETPTENGSSNGSSSSSNQNSGGTSGSTSSGGSSSTTTDDDSSSSGGHFFQDTGTK